MTGPGNSVNISARIEYPVDENGDMMTSVRKVGEPAAGWRPNDPVRMSLELLGYYPTSSNAPRWLWADTQGATWEMSTSAMSLTLGTRTVVQGHVRGWWKVLRKGYSYSLFPCDENGEAER